MIQQLAFALLVVVLAVAAITDMRSGKVYNWLTYPAMLGGLALWTFAGAVTPGIGAGAGFLSALLALLAGLIPAFIAVKMGGLGGGDAKLFGAIGALSASPSCVLAAAVYALIVAVVLAVAVMVRHGLVKRTLGRLLGAALMVGSRVSPRIPDDSPRIAFGAALAVGGMLAGAQHLLGLNVPWAWIGT